MTITLAPGYDMLLAGEFLGPSTLDGVLGYHRDSGAIRIYSTSGNGHLHREHDGDLVAGWTHLLRGRFGGGTAADVLGYNAGTGVAQIWAYKGGHLRHHADIDLGAGWSHVVRGRFGPPSDINALLCYNSTAGTTRAYRLTAAGALHSLPAAADLLAPGWTDLVVTTFDRDRAHADLATYHPGSLAPWASTPDLRLTSLGAPSPVQATSLAFLLGHGVLVYESGRGELTVRAFSGGQWSVHIGPIALPTGFDQVAVGRFGGDAGVDALFYDAGSGEAGIWSPGQANAFLDAM